MSMFDPAIYVDAYGREAAQVQAAVNAAIARGGGEVVFGLGHYDISNLLVEVDPEEIVLTLRGQGIGHETASTVLDVPAGEIGIIVRSSNPQRAATVHLLDFEVRGGATGIHVARPGLMKNMRWRVNCRLQTTRGIFVEADNFMNRFYALIIPAYKAPEDPEQTEGMRVFGYQNRSWYLLEVRQAGAGFVSDVAVSGAEGNSTLMGLFEGNLGPAALFINSDEGNEELAATQFVGWHMEDIYTETDGDSDGRADFVFQGDVTDLTATNLTSSPPSQAQIDSPDGPLLFDIQGVGRRYRIDGIAGGGKAIRIGGVIQLAANHSGVRGISRHLDVTNWNAGGPAVMDEATGRYYRIYVTNGQIMLEDVTGQVVGE